MSLFEKIFSRPQINAAQTANTVFKTLTAYEPVFTNWNGAIYESELVRSAIDARARHISKLQVEIVGSARPSLQTKLRLGPNPWQTWSAFLYRTETILSCKNNAPIVPVYDADLNQIGIYTVVPDRCKIVEYNGEPWLRYEFSRGQTAAVELRKTALLTRFQYKNDFFGSDNDALNETMKLIHLQNQGIKEAVKNGSSFRFLARLNNFNKPEDLKKEATRFNENNLRDGGGLLLFPNTYTDIKQIQSTPYTVDEKQMHQIRTNVFNYFGVNEDILQNKAYGDSWSAFYEGCVENFAIMFSEALTRSLFSERERAAGSEVIATSNRLQYLSNADKLAVSAQMADRGIMTINEIRQIWNLPPVEGGDERTIRGEYYTVDENGNSSKEGQSE